MWLRLIFLNIRELFRTRPVLFVFIIASQVLCIIAAFTVAGMMDAVTQPPDVRDERSDWGRSFQVDLVEYAGNADDDLFRGTFFDSKTNELVYRGTDKDEIEKYENSDVIDGGKYYGELTTLPLNYYELPRYGDIKGKIEKILSSVGRHYVDMVLTGFTSEDIIDYYSVSGPESFVKKNYPKLKDGGIEIYLGKPAGIIDVSEGDKLKLDGTEYAVASVTQKTTRGDIEPLCWLLTENCDDSFIVTYFRIQVDDTLTGDELGHISDLIRSEFSGYTDNIQDPEPKPLIEKQFNNMIYVVSFILMAVMMLNLSRLYTYILAKRKNALAVYSLCGGSKVKIFDIYICEILLTLTVSYVIGFLLFRFAVMGMIGAVYPSFLTFFEPHICAVILGAYIIFGGIVMGLSIAPMINRSVSELRREGGI